MTTAMSALMFFQLYTAIHHFIHKLTTAAHIIMINTNRRGLCILRQHPHLMVSHGYLQVAVGSVNYLTVLAFEQGIQRQIIRFQIGYRPHGLRPLPKKVCLLRDTCFSPRKSAHWHETCLTLFFQRPGGSIPEFIRVCINHPIRPERHLGPPYHPVYPLFLFIARSSFPYHVHHPSFPTILFDNSVGSVCRIVILLQ